jgi:hypothetical protein
LYNGLSKHVIASCISQIKMHLRQRVEEEKMRCGRFQCLLSSFRSSWAGLVGCSGAIHRFLQLHVKLLAPTPPYRTTKKQADVTGLTKLADTNPILQPARPGASPSGRPRFMFSRGREYSVVLGDCSCADLSMSLRAMIKRLSQVDLVEHAFREHSQSARYSCIKIVLHSDQIGGCT